MTSKSKDLVNKLEQQQLSLSIKKPQLFSAVVSVPKMGDVGDELKGYTIIKEGEAEILMHTSNDVFFNKAQVILLLFEGSRRRFISCLGILFRGYR